MNAREFVLSLADQLVSQGRTVEIEEEADSIRIYARARHIAEDALGASAHVSEVTGRWNFQGVRVYRTMDAMLMDRTRKGAERLVRWHGRSFVSAATA